MKKKLRPSGDILLDLEPLLFELVDDHGWQAGDVMANIHQWIQLHYPAAIEQYDDGSLPQYFYGHSSGIKRSKK